MPSSSRRRRRPGQRLACARGRPFSPGPPTVHRRVRCCTWRRVARRRAARPVHRRRRPWLGGDRGMNLRRRGSGSAGGKERRSRGWGDECSHAVLSMMTSDPVTSLPDRVISRCSGASRCGPRLTPTDAKHNSIFTSCRQRTRRSARIHIDSQLSHRGAQETLIWPTAGRPVNRDAGRDRFISRRSPRRP